MINNDLNIEVQNKLILLYTYEVLDRPINPMHISELLLNLNLMDYFTISHYTLELLDKDMLICDTLDEVDHYSISQSGKSALSLFRDRLSKYTEEKIDKGVMALKKALTHERVIKSTVNKYDDANYIVQMQIIDGAYPLISLELNVASNAVANKIVDKWKRDAMSIYGYVLNHVVED